MVRPGRDQLHGTVEVDETFVGGENPRGGAWIEKKALVVIGAEEDGPGIGRIRLATVPDKSRTSLGRFAKEVIAPGSVVHTDGGGGYGGLEKLGYRHRPAIVGWRTPEAANQLLPRVHRVASLLKRWLLGTHQGAVERRAPGLLPRRVHIPLQSAHLALAGQAVLSLTPASGPTAAHRPIAK